MNEILILGAGFGGFAVAQELDRLLPADEDCRVTLLDQNNFSLFTPMLPEVAGGQVDPEAIVVAPRSLSRVRFDQGRVETIDLTRREVTISVAGVAGVPAARRTLGADHLVIALGSVTNFHHIDGLEAHAVEMKTIGDAEALRARAITLLERADEEQSAAARRALLTVVVGGGGFSGVETAAALNDLLLGLLDRYPHVDRSDVRIVLVHAGPRILPELKAGLAAYARRELERRGVEILVDTEVAAAGPDRVELKQGKESRRVETHTLVWTGGVKPNPAVEQAGLKLGPHGGIVVDACCRVPGHEGVWALGDCAEIPAPAGSPSKTYAPTAQNATREGAQVARNILAAMSGRPQQPFIYHPVGELAVVGKRAAVASIYGMHVSGWIAWALWRAIYLAKLPGTAKKIRVGLDWTLDAVFGREVAAVPGVTAHNPSLTKERTGGKD